MFLPASVTEKFVGTWPQLLAAVSGTLSCISDGMQYGWTAPAIPKLLSEHSPVKVTSDQAEWLETILMLGACCGLPLTMYLVDKIGRKASLLGSSMLTLSSWIIIAVAPSVGYIYLARFLAGLAGDTAFVAAPMYIAEVADQKIRGFLSSIIYLMMLAGVLLVYCVAPFVPIWVPCVIGICFNALTLATFPFMPESPYYLLYKNQPGAAKLALRKLRPDGNPESEIQEISAAVERQKSEKGRPRDLISVPSNLRALVIMVWLNGSQHMSGISVMLMNLHSILEEAGAVHIRSSTAAIVFSALMFGAALTASLAIDNFGRRLLLITSGVFAGVSLGVIGGFFAVKGAGYEVGAVSWVVPGAVMCYAAAFKFGLGLVPIVLTAELFPAKLKAVGMTISDACYVGFSVISLQVYHQLRRLFGIQVPFFVFAFWCFLTVGFAVWYVPETKGRSLEEIQFILKGEGGRKGEGQGGCKNEAYAA
ncbi:solute carrier family 2, facilitated glucose transporter member 8-like [Anthonomus grandis grandis]|uniref:solute carrier family 2, facilitated glucose transporter member 8-like n=1 Tax=Anthonomus grandis grandis TaxID=2921223 RepID=UPI0021665702|nr:solute carrier family 2, facilitated glucose transporter member 8-like [Anthonomus grandis grandis]